MPTSQSPIGLPSLRTNASRPWRGLETQASNARKPDEVVTAYSTALSLSPLSPNAVPMKWAGAMLIRGSLDDALSVSAKLKVPGFVVYRVICDILEGDGRLMETVECFRQLQNALPKDTAVDDERVQWNAASAYNHDEVPANSTTSLRFLRRYIEKLEKLGDAAKDSKNHDEAIRYYSTALSLDPTKPNDILLKRSNEVWTVFYVTSNGTSVIHTIQVIEVDPSSHRRYEGKHAALHGIGCHGEAFEAFRTMLLKLAQSSDSQIRELCDQYFDVTPTIQKVVEQTIWHMPCVLIDVTTGRLYDKTRQAAAFEELPIYDELRSPMITHVDHAYSDGSEYSIFIDSDRSDVVSFALDYLAIRPRFYFLLHLKFKFNNPAFFD
ncbi:hypothetical protein HD554DRAFT_1033128 [Boletus coccyginus]|nr:hypothetical protein HD554DRAFT_1033128 [Boletus coccyginus]